MLRSTLRLTEKQREGNKGVKGVYTVQRVVPLPREAE